MKHHPSLLSCLFLEAPSPPANMALAVSYSQSMRSPSLCGGLIQLCICAIAAKTHDSDSRWLVVELQGGTKFDAPLPTSLFVS